MHTLQWIKSFLTNRRQRVRANGELSEFKPVLIVGGGMSENYAYPMSKLSNMLFDLGPCFFLDSIHI